MFLTSTIMNDTTAIYCDTCASEDHYHAVCTEKFFETLKYYTKPVSHSQDQKGTAGKQKAVSSVSFSITPIHILEDI